MPTALLPNLSLLGFLLPLLNTKSWKSGFPCNAAIHYLQPDWERIACPFQTSPKSVKNTPQTLVPICMAFARFEESKLLIKCPHPPCSTLGLLRQGLYLSVSPAEALEHYWAQEMLIDMN